jgi:hypothetical protein
MQEINPHIKNKEVTAMKANRLSERIGVFIIGFFEGNM